MRNIIMNHHLGTYGSISKIGSSTVASHLALTRLLQRWRTMSLNPGPAMFETLPDLGGHFGLIMEYLGGLWGGPKTQQSTMQHPQRGLVGCNNLQCNIHRDTKKMHWTLSIICKWDSEIWKKNHCHKVSMQHKGQRHCEYIGMRWGWAHHMLP